MPVFEWVVNLRCGRGSLSAWALDRGTLASLHALCVELELGMCFVGDSRTLAAVEQAFAERHAETLPGGAKRLLPYPSGVSGDQPLNRLSTRERRELCAWNIQHTMSFLEPGAEARKNEAGSSSRLFDLAECTTGFPECSATVEALLPCLAQAQRGAPVFTALEAKCLQHIDCLWGFALTPSPNP